MSSPLSTRAEPESFKMGKKGKVMGMSVLVLVELMFVLSSLSQCDAYVNKKKLNDSFSLNQLKSSVAFRVLGNVYPDGAYFALVKFGTPSKLYFLDVDTGSSLPWVQCDAPCVHCFEGPHPPYKREPEGHFILVPCVDPICKAVNSEEGKYKCLHPNDQCDYDVKYADNLLSRGVLIKDSIQLALNNRPPIEPSVTFGCGYDQRTSEKESKTDGILALGRGEASIVSQLQKSGLTRNVVGHCLNRGKGPGYVFIGDAPVPSTGVTWTPMSQTGSSDDYYSPGPAELSYGAKPTGVKGLRLIFDSGSTYTYFNAQAYEALKSMITKDLQGKPLESVEDGALPVCWKGRTPFKNIEEVKGYFSSVQLSFNDGKKAQFVIPPAGYLIITVHGNACLGILNGSEVDSNVDNLIGDISFQDTKVIYDNENGQIGWIPADCTEIKKSGEA